MLLIILGVLLLVISSWLKRTPSVNPAYIPVIFIAGIAMLLLGISFSMFKVIEPGKVGVKTLFGKVESDVLPSGLHLINPLVEVTTFDVKTQNYTMSGVTSEGQKEGDDAIRILSADGLEVTIDLSVLFRVKADQTPFILQNIGPEYLDKIVRPVARTAIRDNAVYYDAVALYSTIRQEFQDKIYRTISESFAKRGMELQQLLIRNITLPQSVRATIESKINAEQDAQKMQFVLQKERQEAEQKRIQAQGIADYQRIISTNLTDKQLQYESIQAQKAIALSPNSKVIIMGNSKGVPFILGDKN
ncbi:prohibitin family protein [Mucilaginibacter arboris]|uniref:Prohibitin family protein n=1 Tax=Mucilaginibacter arboris TaxID=2682090 RepID=A0A7K1SVM7_9SPHI|nr:prohibitin family protein [Mucilaginibacter arboris]MVN21344.1 prohibitin family protein [Mucilaginibacter arboris]